MSKLFPHYVKDRHRVIITCAAAIALFLLAAGLSGTDLGGLAYAFLLVAVIIIVSASLDFYHYCNKHNELAKTLESIDVTLAALPQAEDLIGEDYSALIARLNEVRYELESSSARASEDLIDYFTLWVHQIKTPLFAIQLLVGDDDEKIRQEVMKIDQYVRMALSYVRVGSMSSDFDFRKCRLDELARDVVKQYSSVFIGSGIPLAFNVPECTVVTDRKWAGLVIEQILSNSLKYVNDGEISISMPEDKVLEIADTGIGISAEDLPRVFEKGFTGYTGRKYEKSTGIGLYMCKTIMDKLDHDISISSDVGRGTTVRLDFRPRGAGHADR